MENEITLVSLATTAGATAGAALIVAFVSAVVTNLSSQAKRLLSLFSGAGLVVTATFLTTADPTIALGVVAVFNGMIAGLAASKAYEVVTKGLDASVVRSTDADNC